MAVDYKKLKAGDKVRYLGGDRIDEGELIIGEDYVIEGMDDDGDPFFICDDIIEWYIYEYNAHCFELVDDDKSESTCKCGCKHDSHIVSLATKVAELRRTISALEGKVFELAAETSSVGNHAEDDIALLDERLIEVEGAIKDDKASEGDTFITINGSEYIDKLFGGGANE